MLPDSSRGKVKLRNGRATIDMGTMKKPGFLDLRLSAVVAGKTTPDTNYGQMLWLKGKMKE